MPKERINEARKLAYQCLNKIIEIPNKKIGQKVILHNQELMLIDDFDKNACWVGALSPSNELIGVLRLTSARKNGKYRSQIIESNILNNINPTHEVIECGRVAVRPDYRYKALVFHKLCRCAYMEILKMGKNVKIIILASSNNIIKVLNLSQYENIGTVLRSNSSYTNFYLLDNKRIYDELIRIEQECNNTILEFLYNFKIINNI